TRQLSACGYRRSGRRRSDGDTSSGDYRGAGCLGRHRRDGDGPGRIVDDTGGVLPGVTVVITNVGTEEARQVVTNDRGEYTVHTLPRGNYSIRAALSGFQPIVMRGLEVRVNEVVRADITLKAGGLSEVIEVTGTTPLLQTQRGDLMDVVEHRAII